MRVVIAADFPVHCLPGFEHIPVGHHATWLTPLAQELADIPGLDIHWITCSKQVASHQEIHHLNQTFHLLPRHKLSLEILTRFRRERRLIAKLVGKLQPALFHGWGTEQGYGLAANDFPGTCLISLQGILSAYCSASPMPLLTRIQAATEKAVLSKARHLTVESPWGASQLQNLAPQAKIHLLEYGADPACFEIQRSPSEEDRRSQIVDRRSENPTQSSDPESSFSPSPLITDHCSLLTSPSSSTNQQSTINNHQSSISPSPTKEDSGLQIVDPRSENPDSPISVHSRPFAVEPSSSSSSSPSSSSDLRPSTFRLSDREASTSPSSTFDVQSSMFKVHLPLALFVGTLSHLKGCDTLLDAFSDPRLKDIELVILGALSPEFTRRSHPPNIHFLGHRPPAEVRDWMANAWCLVHPTRADTSPNAVKEARVIGLPVVTTPNGGQTQYVIHNESGFIHDAGDVEDLIQGVLTVTKSRETSLQMGHHGQAECRAALSPTTTAKRLLEIYQTLGPTAPRPLKKG